MLSSELELGHCEDCEQQLLILRHTCQRLDFASGQQQGTEDDTLKNKRKQNKKPL